MFIEIENIETDEKELINLEYVNRILPSEDYDDVAVIEIGSCSIHIKETYEQFKERLKKIFKNNEETGEKVNRFEILDLRR